MDLLPVGIVDQDGISKPNGTALSLDAKTNEQDFSIIAPRKISKKTAVIDDDEPLIDTTEALTLKSKKIERLKKRQEKKAKRTTVKSETKSFLQLPTELLDEVLSYLQPSDILLRVQLLDKTAQRYVQENEDQIARSIISLRYPILSKSFHTPIPFPHLSPSAQASLLCTSWQERMKLHKRAYQHILPIGPNEACTCMTCVLSWNNLNLILDLSHFQPNLSERRPIEMVPRGRTPKWNEDLIIRNATIARRAMHEPLVYATLLQIHLETITATLMRPIRVGKKTHHPSASKRLYRITEADVDAGTDGFLERSGPPSYEFPFHRDHYYSLEAYVPNRKWDKELQRWLVAAQGVPHESDLAWVIKWFPRKGE